jgi:hypothetical protein
VRQFSLYAISLVLSLCGTVSAQQTLVEYKDKNDPCGRFKMRILVPDNNIDFKLRVEKPKDGIDYKMVWNPCLQPELPFAFAPAQPAPERQRNFVVPRSFRFQFPTVKSGQKKQSEFLLPQHPSPFEFKWPQQK